MSTPVPDSPIQVTVRDSKRSARRIRVLGKPDPVIGKFWFEIAVTADAKDIYLPLSVASGKKPTGFVYQIEGTAAGSIMTADVTCRGEGITQVKLGTLIYAKIPAGMTALFRLRVEMRGLLSKSYRILIRQIHFKFDPGDARYQKSPQHIHSRMLKFR